VGLQPDEFPLRSFLKGKFRGEAAIKTTQKHYATWVKTREDAIESAVK
jgi:hypothetical protein